MPNRQKNKRWRCMTKCGHCQRFWERMATALWAEPGRSEASLRGRRTQHNRRSSRWKVRTRPRIVGHVRFNQYRGFDPITRPGMTTAS